MTEKNMEIPALVPRDAYRFKVPDTIPVSWP